MRLELSTWNSHNINDGTNYQAVIQPGNTMPSATANFIDIGQGNPVLAGKTLDGGYFTIHIILRGNVETQRDTLNGWFSPADFTPHKLVALDKDNGDKDWYLEGYPVTPPMISEGNAKYSVTLALTTPYWIENDLNTNTWSVTSNTETEVMTNAGNTAALPKIAITPVHVKSSNELKYKKFIAIHTSGWGGLYIPVDITAGGLDTAALVGAGKMLASGNDLTVILNGVSVWRWFGGGGINSATTTVWAYLIFSPAPTMILQTAMDNSVTPATFTARYTGAVTLPQNGILQIDSEIITYSTYTLDPATSIITFTTTLRAAKGSSKAAHTVTDNVYWIENDLWLAYGNAAATAPAIDDTYKPVNDLTSSVNGELVYLIFGTSALGSTLLPFTQGTAGFGNYYCGTHGVLGFTPPRINAGIKLSSKLIAGGVAADVSCNASWVFTHPGGISNFEGNGEKYRSDAIFGTLTITDGTGGTVFATEATPAAPANWEAIAINTACSGNPTQVKFSFKGALETLVTIPTAYAEMNDVTITIADPPTITAIGSEGANYKLSGSLLNDNTDYSILFNDVATKTGETVTIDCETKEIYSTDGQRIRGMISFGGGKRDEWLTLEPGANSIVFTDVGTAEVTIVTTWRGRNTI